MEKTQKFQIVYVGPTNLCYHSTTDLVRGIMTNERKQSVLSKARSFKHSKTTSSLFAFYLSVKLVPRGVDFTHFNTCCSFKCTTVSCCIQAANLAGFRASEDPRFEAGIPDFMNGILNFSIHFNVLHRKVDWRNPKMKSLNSMPVYIYLFFLVVRWSQSHTSHPTRMKSCRPTQESSVTHTQVLYKVANGRICRI